MLRGLFRKIDELLIHRGKIGEELLEELEEILIQADISISTTRRIIDDINKEIKQKKLTDPFQIRFLLKDRIEKIISKSNKELKNSNFPPSVFLIIGVNGTGKTTTIAKLAYKFINQKKRVMLVAADTFRAAAIDQLEIWANRLQTDIIKQKEGADSAAVVYDALQAAKSRKTDCVIIDTAGRLHTKRNLMEELKKIYRIICKEINRPPDEVLLVLDATTGQNAVSQLREFNEITEISGIVLTKLDGSAKGGIIVTLIDEFKIPLKLIAMGETLEDLREFSPSEFANALFEE